MIVNFLYAAVLAGTPLLFGTVGEIITEKSGHLNLGVEGMMYIGAVTGFMAGYYTASTVLALLAAFAGGLLGALIYAFLTITLKANQNVTGLALTIFGTGLANMLGDILIQNAPNNVAKLPSTLTGALSSVNIPGISEGTVGKLFFSYSPMVYLGIAIAVASYFYICRTRAGRNLRAVGENPAAADAAGINVTLVRYTNVMLGGGICGLGGAYISLITSGGVWNNNCVNGTGWIAVALVIFASWGTVKAILGSLVFGGFSVLQFYMPKDIINLPNAFYVMLPFLCTVIVLIITSIRQSREHSQPQACGTNYFREER